MKSFTEQAKQNQKSTRKRKQTEREYFLVFVTALLLLGESHGFSSHPIHTHKQTHTHTHTHIQRQIWKPHHQVKRQRQKFISLDVSNYSYQTLEDITDKGVSSKRTTKRSRQRALFRNQNRYPSQTQVQAQAQAQASEWNINNQMDVQQGTKLNLQNSNFNVDLEGNTIIPIISTSLLITGNTVGAGMLVLPDLARGPGMGLSSLIFGASFLINWISGLLIAQVAIHQHNNDALGNNGDIPSSFKEFAQANLPGKSDTSANFISGISIMVNALVLAFNTAKVGEFGTSFSTATTSITTTTNNNNNLLMVFPPTEMLLSWGWMAACVMLVSTQTFSSLSTITSFLVFGLFLSFAGLLLPGLAHMDHSFMDVLQIPGTASTILSTTTLTSTSTIVSSDSMLSSIHSSAAYELAPIVLMSLVYQNIVPTVTKMLNYDTVKVVAAITMGSLLPLGMYLAWAVCVVGGGVDMTANGSSSSTSLLDGHLMTVFTFTTLAGSSIGCVMSLAEEFDTLTKGNQNLLESIRTRAFLTTTSKKDINNDVDDNDKNKNNDDTFSFTSVLLSVACAEIALQFFQDDLNGALKVAGSFGSPLLYGILPIVMIMTQQQEEKANSNNKSLNDRVQKMK